MRSAFQVLKNHKKKGDKKQRLEKKDRGQKELFFHRKAQFQEKLYNLI